MVKSRRKYDKEFKLMAVELMETHKNVKEVSEELGVCADLPYLNRISFNKKSKGNLAGILKRRM